MTARHIQQPNPVVLLLARRLAALLALSATIVLPPAVLLLAAGSPFDPPAALRSRDILTNPVDDRTLLWLIATLAWLVYVHLLASLCVELLRQTRGLNWQVPCSGLLFGANTALAGHLIAGVLLTSQPGALSTPAPAMLHAALTTPVLTAPATSSAFTDPMTDPALAPASTPASAATPGGATELPECRVLPPDGRDHDTLWDIAERHLGDGLRWREIYALNDNRLMPDGRRLTKASLIHPGWILRLPADALRLDIDRVPNQPTGEASAGETRASATEMTPSTAPHEPTAHSRGSGSSDADAAEVPVASVPVAPARSEHPLISDQPRAADDLPGRSVGNAIEQPHDASPEHAEEQAPDQPDGEPGDEESDSATAAGLGALALASLGLLGALTRRRKVAARRRPVGARSQRPSPELLEEEQRIRYQARLAETTAATVRLALLLADRHSARTELKALWQHSDGSLELCWTEPSAAPAVAPFHSTDHGWLLPASAHPLLYATRRHPSSNPSGTDGEAQDTFDPVPLLMPVGHRGGSALLVNLELYGAVTLTSTDPDSTVPLEALTAWLRALASAPWSLSVHTHVPTALGDIATGLERITVTDTIAPPVALTEAEAAQVATLGSLAAARRANPDLHAEDLTVYAGYDTNSIPNDVLDGASRRQLPVMLVLLNAPDAAAAEAPLWTFEQSLLTIPGLATGITPIRTDRATHERILRLLEHAQDPPLADPHDPQLAHLHRQCPPDRSALAEHGTASVIDLNGQDTPATIADDDNDGEDDDAQKDRAAALVADLPPGAAQESGPDASPAKTGPKSAAIPERTSTGPIEIGVLGPATLSGLDMDPPRSITLDLLIYYAFHRRPISSRELWTGLFPDKPYQDTTLRGRRSELRRLVHPLLHKVGQKHYLDDLASTDWQRFQALADGNPDQQLAALKLVRGRPFDNCQHDWMHLEGQITEIEAAIADLAIEVAKRALARSDYATARAAAHAGLLGVPHEERLYRLGMQAAAAAGATSEVQQLRRQLNVVILDELDPDDEMQPATVELLKHLADEERREQLSQRRRNPGA